MNDFYFLLQFLDRPSVTGYETRNSNRIISRAHLGPHWKKVQRIYGGASNYTTDLPVVPQRPHLGLNRTHTRTLQQSPPNHFSVDLVLTSGRSGLVYLEPLGKWQTISFSDLNPQFSASNSKA